jgi:hypothetical protein
MRANMWSRILVALCFFSLTAQANPPVTHDPGTRVSIKLAETSGALPEPEKMIEPLMAVGGGERQVRVLRRDTSGQQEITLDLWGATVPQTDIPKTLRDAFPVLASADIQVTTLDPNDRPKREGGDRLKHFEKELEKEGRDGEKRVIKKVVKIIKKE